MYIPWPCIVSFILFCLFICLFIYFGFKRSNVISSFIIIAYYFKVGDEIRVCLSTYLLWAHIKKPRCSLATARTDDDDIHLFLLPSLNLTLHCLHMNETQQNRIRFDVLREQQNFYSLPMLCTWQKEMNLFCCYRCYWDTTRAYGVL